MLTEAVHFIAPDGRDMVVMTKELYEQLSARALDSAAAAKLGAIVLDMPQAVRDAAAQGMSTLAAWREHRGLSQAQLARVSGVHRITILRMEAGGFGSGQLKTRDRLAAALNVPLAAI